MHKARVDQLLQFALAVAAEEEFGNRELGVIHLLKLLYLADLAHAERHHGEIYTGIEWVLYNFGPWDPAAHREIDSLMGSLGLAPRTFTTPRFEIRRFSLPPDHRLAGTMEELGRGLPIEVYLATKRHVHTFGADTESLLHFVYKTVPMLRTKPGERIDFSYAAVVETVEAPPAPAVTPLSRTKAKRKEERRLEMKKEIQERIEARIRMRQSNAVTFLTDSAFVEIQSLLNEEDFFGPPNHQGKLSFDQSIWESDFRRECGLP